MLRANPRDDAGDEVVGAERLDAHQSSGFRPRTWESLHSATRLTQGVPWLCGPASRRVCYFVGWVRDRWMVPPRCADRSPANGRELIGYLLQCPGAPPTRGAGSDMHHCRSGTRNSGWRRGPSGGGRSPAGRRRGRPGPTSGASRSRPPCRGRGAPPRRPAGARSGERTGGRPRRGPSGVSPSKVKPVPVVGWAVDVDDGVAQAAGGAHDRRRAVAQRDHLAGAARLEARRHEEAVRRRRRSAARGRDRSARRARSGRARRGRGKGAERLDDLGIADAQDDEAEAALEQRRRRLGEQVEALLAVEPADHRRGRAARSVGIQAEPVEQRGAAAALPERFVAGVAGGQRRVRRRVPELGVEAVEDPEEAVALVLAAPRRGPSRTPGVSASAAKPGLTVFTSSARSMPARRRSRPSAPPAASPEPEPQLRDLIRRRPAVVGEVVDRQEERGAGRSPGRRRAGRRAAAAPAPCASRGCG